MKKTLLLGLVVLGTTFAASNNYKVNLYQDSVIAGKTFKAGEYKISLENGNAVIKQGKQTVQVPARQETEATQAASNELLYKGTPNNLAEIRLGGTHTKIVFDSAAPMTPGS